MHVPRPSIAAHVGHRLWTLFWMLVALQALDLETTYVALSTGVAHEGNPFFAAVILTPGAPMFKVPPLMFLAALIVCGTRYGRPAPRRLLIVAHGLVVVYIAIVVNNLILAMRFG